MVIPVGTRSKSAQAKGCEGQGPIEAEADLWFSNWKRGGVLLEEARYLTRWDQTLTLLWFEAEEIPQEHEIETEENMGLKEFDGMLPWTREEATAALKQASSERC
jgi:hypothetical protein